MFLRVGQPLCYGLLFLLCIQSSCQQEEGIPHNEVENWALKVGVDLWEFGKQVTRISEIIRKYHGMEANVIRKDGLLLVREMATEVKNMLDFKINAVMKLMESAEQAAVSAPRDSATKFFTNHRSGNHITADGKVNNGWANHEIHVLPNRHFDHLYVNVSMSAVLLPSGVQTTDGDVAAGIQWTEYLEPLFVDNYESDPSLSWQYYGATAGFLRRFPAVTGSSGSAGVNGAKSSGDRAARNSIHDFRTSNWFVGAANSPKDLAILLDAAAFDAESNRRLAIATTKAILDTLGPDDYVNVYRYGDSAEEIVQCFKDSIVQASPENIQELKLALYSVKPDEESATNISAALSTAFEILHKYNRTGQGSQCNQAIMLVTADSEGAPPEVIKRYNWPHMPVRIFAYLVGGAKSPDLWNTACNNKGFYARVTEMEHVRAKVFEYVKVLARPMVLYQHDHPIHWSPAYVGGKSDRYARERRGQLMTSVSAPILDRQNHTVKTANLLGVVGTDVLIAEIQKRVPTYRMGVNGYSFMVDNNGRVIYHPDLRPLPGNLDYEDTLKPMYTNVDLSEVELAEYDGPSYPLNNTFLLDLRHEMIDQREGETDFTVKIHYDDMRRVTIRKHNYFYTPIEGTPFSLGLALPEGYGMVELDAEQEIKHSIVNVTEYFKGSNWKVHPDWVYCEYNSVSEKWFSSPEERVLHFLSRTRNPGWKWMSIRPRSPSSHHKQASKPDKNAYYCDKKLLQSLVLDALVTEGFDRRSAKEVHKVHKDENQSQGKGRFDLTRTFIATRSGLFRWHDHRQTDEPADEAHFAETYARAMDSSWYKRAVDQHAVEPESFVFSVPFDAADSPNPLVTATRAVFIENKGYKAPAAVVGFQFQHSSLASHFINVTSTCTSCKKNCASDELDCYILDNSGFVIISERHEHIGRFFGEIDGTIMDSLVQDKIYRKVTVIDYQGVCHPQESRQSSAPRTITRSILGSAVSFGNFLWSAILHMNLQDLWQSALAYGEDDAGSLNDDLVFTDEVNDPDDNDGVKASADSIDEATPEGDEFSGFPAGAPPIPASPPTTRATSAHYPHRRLRSCEKKTDLYILQPEKLNTSGQSTPLKGKLTNCHVTGCERPFSVQKITHTNLILLVVDTLCPCGSKYLSIEPIEAITEPGACTARRERLYRRRPPKCINYHPEEMEIKYCGGASSTQQLSALTRILNLGVAAAAVLAARFT